MAEAKPHPKSAQLARGERRYRRKVASPKPADPSVSPADTPALCPGCGRPVNECRAEDVDESYHPAVSPADTLRQWIKWSARNAEEEKAGLAALDALLAVGERDKAIREAVDNIEGDLYLHAIGEITTETLRDAIREAKDKLKEASGYVG